MKKKHSRTKVLHSHERTLFYVSATFVLTVCALYVYFLCISVIHVVARTATDRDISRVTTHINDLESRFIKAKQTVTLSAATERGFVNINTKDKVYVMRKPGTLVLSHNDES